MGLVELGRVYVPSCPFLTAVERWGRDASRLRMFAEAGSRKICESGRRPLGWCGRRVSHDEAQGKPSSLLGGGARHKRVNIHERVRTPAVCRPRCPGDRTGISPYVRSSGSRPPVLFIQHTQPKGNGLSVPLLVPCGSASLCDNLRC